MDRLEEVAPHALESTSRSPRPRRWQGQRENLQEEVRKIEIALPAGLLRRQQEALVRERAGQQRARTGVLAEVREDCRLARRSSPSVRLWRVPSRRHSRKLQYAGRPYVTSSAELGYAVHHSIHKNDLARDGGAAGAGVPRDAEGKAPKEAVAKILEYKEMEPFFVIGESDEP